MSSSIEARMTIARAAIASSVASRIEVPVAGTDLNRTDELADRQFFTIFSAMPAGYHMETELLPLEAIMRDVEVVVRSDKEDGDGDRSMTVADHRLEEINAFVHDRLLNPILSLRAETPSVTALRPINEVYGEVLRHGSFAGGIAATSSRYEEAEALLFQDGAPTEVLETYRQYESDVQDARSALNELDGSESQQEREDAQRRLDRLVAEWIGIGRKPEIEEAFRILQEETDAAGHERERSRLLERFRAGEKARIDAPGLSFHRVNLVPISPLFNDQSGPQWQQVELDAEAVRSSLTAHIQVALEISNEDVAIGVEDLQKLTFEFVQCDIIRDWLDTDLFSARYWKLGSGEDPLSDGRGGGRMPVIPETVIFIRNARVIYEGETTVVFGDDPADAAAPGEMASIQVLGVDDEADDDGEDDTPLIEAARSAGLSSSLNILNKESERLSRARNSRVMAVQQERLVPRRSRDDGEGGDDEDDGGGGGFLSRALNTIRDAVNTSTTVRRQQVQRQSSSRRPSMSLRPSVVAREVSGERQARPARENPLVRDHRGSSGSSSSSNTPRSRSSRAARGTIRVRDHRSSVRTRSPSERRRRDHRDRDDDRERTRVPARRGQAARRSSINLEGRLEASEGYTDRLSGLNLAYIISTSSDQETTVNLQRSSGARLTFSETVRDRSGDDDLWFEFILRDSEGDELDRQVVIPDDEETVELRWTIAAQPVSLELAGKLTPTLHGYRIRVLPESPNPDESLDWG